MFVPFLDLKAQYQSIKEEIDEAISEVVSNTAFAGGKYVDRFEQAFSRKYSYDNTIAVGSGTEALWAALVAYGIGADDEVITVPNTFIATVEAISFCGATPVFVDIDDKTYTMDPVSFERAITPKTKAVIPVHLYGQPADMDSINEIAKKHGLIVIEDACQAHGSCYKGQPVGTLGDAGCFSFYPGKNLGAFGEGGAVVTNNSAISDKIRMFRDHGQSKKYYHSIIGWNVRMDGIQGAVLNVKLNYIEEWNDARRKCADKYRELLSSLPEIVLPYEASYSKHVYHIYALHIANRQEFIDFMKEKNVSCGIHYPVPVHLQKAYDSFNADKGKYPKAEKSASEEVSLPMFPELTDEQIEYTAEAVREYVQ